MQYFRALKMGQKRVEASRAYLNSISNDRAMPALALRDNKTNVWEPVGEENAEIVSRLLKQIESTQSSQLQASPSPHESSIILNLFVCSNFDCA